MSDILSIRQQQQAQSSMTDIESDSMTKNQDQTPVCQCDICQETQAQPTLLARLWLHLQRLAPLLLDLGRACGRG